MALDVPIHAPPQIYWLSIAPSKLPNQKYSWNNLELPHLPYSF
jgi:hypothetical protein